MRTELTSLHCRPENSGVLPVVIAELELGNLERQILGGHFVGGADNTALEDRPEAFDGIRMHRANNILAQRVVNNRVGIFAIQTAITNPFISAKQANFIGDAGSNETMQSISFYVFDHAGNQATLTSDGTGHHGLARAYTTRSAWPALIPMLVFFLAANKRLINFNNAHELLKAFIGQSSADTVAHVPSGAVRAEAHHALDLKGADTLLAHQHEVNDLKPYLKVNIRILKHSADKMRKTIGRAHAAIHALPFVSHCFQFNHVQRTTTRAVNAVWPALLDKVGITRRFVMKHRLKLGDGKLLDGGHGGCSLMMKGA